MAQAAPDAAQCVAGAAKRLGDKRNADKGSRNACDITFDTQETRIGGNARDRNQRLDKMHSVSCEPGARELRERIDRTW